MLAAVYDAPGPAENLRLARVPVPVPMLSEVIVRVVAASLNPIDAKTRAGGGASAGIASYPALIGADFSGVVEAVPYSAFPLQPGDEVYGMVPVPRYPGTYAQRVAVPELSITRKPTALSHEEAAAVPLAALTAWGMIELADVQPGQRVFISGASGGVGHFAVQFAALRGARVVGLASARNLEFMRGLGAAEALDYAAGPFEEATEPVDAVIDLIGNVHADTGTRSLGLLRPGGILVNAPTGSWPTLAEEAERAGVRASTYKVAPDARVLARITDLIDSGAVRVELAEVFDLERIVEAHRSLESGHTRGKIALRIPQD